LTIVINDYYTLALLSERILQSSFESIISRIKSNNYGFIFTRCPKAIAPVFANPSFSPCKNTSNKSLQVVPFASKCPADEL
jgi:hypothetical protein